MNTSDRPTDELIQAAFERRAQRGDLAGLREIIEGHVAATQQRLPWRARLDILFTTPNRRPASVALLLVLGLLVAALAIAIVGQRLRTPLRSGTWTPAANMLQARWGSSATLLLDGAVLVPGGWGAAPGNVAPGPILASCELYDPSIGAWTATSRMHDPRVDFAAARLSDGTVLVAGGKNWPSYAALDSAEIYDPGTGSWASVGRMTEARAGFSATSLSDGRVLVVGGYKDSTTSFGPNASAELYDSISRSWTAPSTMLEARVGFTATLLGSGKVLVAGGNTTLYGPATATAELYDPATGSWARTGSMLEARAAASATLLPDGEVLVAGGHRGSGSHEDAVASAELYSPSSGTWTATGTMIAPDAFLTSTLLLDGRVLVAGGYKNDTPAPDRPELYDPIARSWTLTGAGFLPTTGPGATLLLDGRVLLAGGSVIGNAINTAQIYDPAGGT